MLAKHKMYFRNLFLLFAILFVACGHGFLDIKRDQSQVVPQSIADYEAVFHNMSLFNRNSSHLLSFVGSDEYYLKDDDWAALTDPYQKNGYVWGTDVYQHLDVADWDNAYHRILLANLALEGLERISPTVKEKASWNRVKGTALFFRAMNYYCLAQQFCRPYDKSTASTDPGVPMRLEADITMRIGRGSVEALYNRIIDDIINSLELLPERSASTLLPARQASEGLLAKTYLQMGRYEDAMSHAERCLALGGLLIDFNTIDTLGYYPFPTMPYSTDINQEIIFFSAIPNIAVTDPMRLNVDTLLYAMYTKDDLRRTVYFEKDAEALFNGETNKLLFKGSYNGEGPFGYFTGIALDEIYLIAAESAARTGQPEKALGWLNYLLENRYKKGAFEPIVSEDEETILAVILMERRKELIFRGVLWGDLRRLNKDENYARTMYRSVRGPVVSLEPLSKRYVWPIPDEEIALGGLVQNER